MGRKDKTLVLTGVFTVTSKGKTYTYFRRAGHPLVRLPDQGDPDFLAAYAAARKAKPTQRHGKTARDAITAALGSDAFQAFSPAYRALLRRQMDAMSVDLGDLPMTGLRTRHIEADVASAPVPFHRMKAWRFLCKVAKGAGIIMDDPSATAALPRLPQSDGHPPWTPDDITVFRHRYQIGTVARAAMELLYWTGCRLGDVVTIGPGNVGNDGVLAYVQTKTKARAYVPWTCDLPAYAVVMKRDRDIMHEAILPFTGQWFLATNGQRRSHKALGTVLGEACRNAGLDRSAHGLRKARAMALAEAGATVHQIASWTGHITLSEVERYTREADRRRAVMGG